MKKIEKPKVKVKNISGYIIAGIIALIIAIVGYSLLIAAENAVLGKYDKNDVYIAKEDIAEGTQLTEDMFVAHSIDSAVIPTGAITDVSALANTYATINIPKNMVVTSDYVKNIKDAIVGDKEIGINTADLAGSVNGILRASDFIDIYIVPNTFEKDLQKQNAQVVMDNGDGTTSVVTPTASATMTTVPDIEPAYTRVYVNRVFNDEGNLIANNDVESLATRFNITLPAEDANYLISALQVSKIYIVIDRDDEGSYSFTKPKEDTSATDIMSDINTKVDEVINNESDEMAVEDAVDSEDTSDEKTDDTKSDTTDTSDSTEQSEE